MKALIDVTAKVDGVQYYVPAGREVPTALVAYWTECNMLTRLKTQGAVESEVVSSESASSSKTKTK